MRGEMSGRVVISWTKGETRCRGLMLRVAVSALQDTAFHVRAEVVELVDALDSKSSGRKPVGVRFPPSAPNLLSVITSTCANSPRESSQVLVLVQDRGVHIVSIKNG